MIGIILAGGRATRLGPLAAQLNKSLVTVGAQPMLVRQVLQLREVGCTDICVVVSPGSQDQVECVIERAGLPGVTTAVQRTPRGPGDALYEGLDALHNIGRDDEVMVMTADTLLDGGLADIEPSSVVVAEAPSERPWCFYGQGQWHDGIRGVGERVAIGVYRFPSAGRLFLAARGARERPAGFGGEVQLSTIINLLHDMYWQQVDADRWHDVGDVPALANTNREHFIARDFHGVSMTEPGVILKTGVSEGEREFMLHPPGDSQVIVPRAWDGPLEDSYVVEYVDMPTLAELWLYWPSQPDMWEHVGANLAYTLKTHLWSKAPGVPPELYWEYGGRVHKMFVDKLLERYVRIPHHFPQGNVVFNDRAIHTGQDVVMRVAEASKKLLKSTHSYVGYVHGDPTFSNVLWSLKAGTFKLLDPRGDFGGPGALGDYRYDLAKIANGPQLAAVMHDLFDIKQDGERAGLESWTLNVWPYRVRETESLWGPLTRYIPRHQLRVLRANQLLSSAPLHDVRQGQALYLMGCALAQDLK